MEQDYPDFLDFLDLLNNESPSSFVWPTYTEPSFSIPSSELNYVHAGANHLEMVGNVSVTGGEIDQILGRKFNSICRECGQTHGDDSSANSYNGLLRCQHGSILCKLRLESAGNDARAK